MSGPSWPGAFWWGVAAAGALYVSLFALARRPVALRLGRLGWLLGLALLGRLALAAGGYPLAADMDGALTGAALLGAIGLRLSARVWLVKAGADDLRRQIEEACRGLFLGCEETRPAWFRLIARGSAREIKLIPAGTRLQLVLLPRPGGHGKVALLVEWLSKQYPGPVPRLRRVLKRRL